MERPIRRIVGGVLDGSDIVHVLYRPEGPGAHEDLRRVDIARFVLLDGAWSLDIAAQWHDIIDTSWFMMVIDDSFSRDNSVGSVSPDV